MASLFVGLLKSLIFTTPLFCQGPWSWTRRRRSAGVGHSSRRSAGVEGHKTKSAIVIYDLQQLWVKRRYGLGSGRDIVPVESSYVTPYGIWVMPPKCPMSKYGTMSSCPLYTIESCAPAIRARPLTLNWARAETVTKEQTRGRANPT